MKKISIPLLLISAALVMAFAIDTPLPIGSPLPKADLKMKDISGKEISVKEVKKANGVLVMFSCNTCPYVVKNQQRTKDICTYADQKNIGVIILNSNAANRNDEDSYAAMKNYAASQQYKWIYAADDNNMMADAFGASRTPECYLFNKDLKLVYHGAIDNNPSDADNVTRKHLQIAIDELTSGKQVSMAETKSVGCGIKRIKN